MCVDTNSHIQAAKRRALKTGEAIPLDGDAGDEAKQAERADLESAELDRGKVRSTNSGFNC